ncbi:MAG: DUF6268 family outer membrane beta-barrel protein, partial [Robiginitalea sp.]|uniref:DUF6268 family outer membrane beta-barrel protein n=1 Tax=Robiginitalea sp. TaxID=1902411 RepID=UPI003C707370
MFRAFLLGALLLFGSLRICAQSYLDLITASYNYSPPSNFEISDETTSIQNADVSVSLPFPIEDGPILLPGVNMTVNRLNLDPASPEATTLYAAALHIGLRMNYGNDWSGTHYLFPRLSTAFQESRAGLQIATLQLFEKQKSSHSSYGFGVYASKESFGWMLVPLFSFYYQSPDKQYEVRLFLPSRGDVNYRLTDHLRAGLYFDGLGTSHDLQSPQFGASYVQRISNDLQAYLRFDLTPSLLLALRAGYSFFRTYKVYEASDTAGVSIANIFFNDNRTPLNQTVEDGFIFGVRIIYR